MDLDIDQWTDSFAYSFLEAYKHCQFVKGETEMRVKYMLVDPPPTLRKSIWKIFNVCWLIETIDTIFSGILNVILDVPSSSPQLQ